MNEREPFDQWWVDQVRQLDELSLYDFSRRVWQTATLVEQERCAKVCEGLQVNKSPDYYPGQAFDGACRTCAAAIRKGEEMTKTDELMEE